MHTLKITEHVPPMVQFICGISEGLSLIHITLGPFLLSQAWNPRKSKKKNSGRINKGSTHFNLLSE